MKRNDPYPGDWLCWSCEFYGTGWTYVGYQDDGKGGKFLLANCPKCHSTVNPKCPK